MKLIKKLLDKFSNVPRENLFLGAVFSLYVLCASKYIGNKESIFYSNVYKLILLMGVLFIYPYHRQTGVILLIIVMVTHMPFFREKVEHFISNCTEAFTGVLETPSPTSIKSSTTLTPTTPTVNMNNLEDRESNYYLTIEKRKEQSLQKNLNIEGQRMKLLQEEGEITPLEKDIIKDIQIKFDNDIDLITTDDFEKISKYTDEGDPINAGLLPKKIEFDKEGIDFKNLIRTGDIINF
jgi:hypothetical protein